MYILYQQHISWFETEMALETLKSVEEAIKHTNLKVKIKLCFNAQTKYESPIIGTTKDMFDILLSDRFVQQSEIVWKTDEDDFYNVGDWRRDCYDNQNITIWGESDCLVPVDYFFYIETIFENTQSIPNPFIITIRQKKMWDESWKATEHELLQDLDIKEVRAINNKFVTGEGHLTYEELNKFNNEFSDKHEIIKSSYYKGDGALVCLSPNMPLPFIPQELHMCGEDTYFFNYCNLKKIPLYNISYYLKGHNTNHPLKRMNYSRSNEQKEKFLKLDNNMRLIAKINLESIK